MTEPLELERSYDVFLEELNDLLIEDVLSFMREPHPQTQESFECGYRDQCGT
jgi:hypothetical protein